MLPRDFLAMMVEENQQDSPAWRREMLRAMEEVRGVEDNTLTLGGSNPEEIAREIFDQLPGAASALHRMLSVVEPRHLQEDAAGSVVELIRMLYPPVQAAQTLRRLKREMRDQRRQ
ncbi:hypothetical protein [Geobacter sp. AOG1]|uniref:hypothetical protein n=1 Tax=Geobacter sp. AOG1 TaxID=1566346 RepID=UPI001CC5518E|nr:hypothetical protein [Geobacter sp. AOG1]GFE57735.1 hypothetical protein AOG1_16150 [Geobacter sp. AOG1]